jgi:hypothetical protein
MLFLFFAASAAPIEACSAAMNGLGSVSVEAVLAACPVPPKRELWTGDYDDRCDDAFTDARSFAKMAHGLPPVMIAGMIRSFQAEAKDCTKPLPPPKPLPPDCAHVRRLWC